MKAVGQWFKRLLCVKDSYQFRLDAYITSKQPKSAAEVEDLIKRFDRRYGHV